LYYLGNGTADYRHFAATQWDGYSGGFKKGCGMLSVVVTTNDPVVLTFVEAVLTEAGIMPVLLDQHMSVMEGSIGLLPRRLAVAREDRTQAVSLLERAGLSEWITQDDTV
jgi:hypothetical protein